MVNYIHSTVLTVRIVITLAGMVYKEPCVRMQTSQHHLREDHANVQYCAYWQS